MAQVSVTIAGRVYRIACGEGEETHLRGLARQVDDKIDQLRGTFGEIGDQRLTVMAAITLADELLEAQRKLADLAAEHALAEARVAAQTRGEAEWTDHLAHSLNGLAERIERVATKLNAAERPDGAATNEALPRASTTSPEAVRQPG
ncbi:cell division protein ZapA [Beijerinckia indica]|uniref:Cell division protein ZapA n=1 Tax=Beijerinckia indica subsp. indica (strain ATCC 9039 / DSM 1715 / NCIMB 8712) TaxID=395963 RepID=B2IFC7_BEII9|nr:protein of unknown function DUF710 [Beijerinckia indica subsp. indica ATCC 9039]